MSLTCVLGVLLLTLAHAFQVDLVDFQSCPDGPYLYLLNYQDHGSKFYDNAALTNKRASTIATALLDIFSVIGPPCILQCDNGKEFSNVASTSTELADAERATIKKNEAMKKNASIGRLERVPLDRSMVSLMLE